MARKYNIDYSKYIGKTFGCLTVNNITKETILNKDKKTDLLAHCSCACGNKNHTRLITSLNISQCCEQCYMGKPLKSFIGKTFGQLTVIDAYTDLDKGIKRFKCKCICGNIVERNITEILNRQHNFKCGNCYNGIAYNNYIGKTFGSFKILDVYSLKKNGKQKRMYAKIKCTCGLEYERKLENIDFNYKKLGCKHCDNGKPWESHIGEKYGKLTVIGITSTFKRGYNLTQAVCKCECEQEVKRTFSSLHARGQRSSCGQCIKGIFFKNYIGKQYGNLTVVDVIKDKRGAFNFVLKCSCGNENSIIRIANNVLTLASKNIFQTCGECNKGVYYKDFIGKRYGYLEIINYKNNFFELQCDCGNIIKLKTSYVNSFNSRIATCTKCYKGISYSKIINNQFGRLKIKNIQSNQNNKKHRIAICSCLCGKQNLKINFTRIMTGSVLSCGCLHQDIASLKKIKFGNLLIKCCSKNNVNGLRYICKCDCGNEIEVLESDLFTGKVTCCNECKEIM